MLERAFGLRILPIKAHMLPHMPRPVGQHTQSGHGEGRHQCEISVQAFGLRVHCLTRLHREDRARGDLRMPAIPMPLSGRLMQMAGTARSSHAAPDDVAQEHYHAAGRRYCLSGHRYQSARCRRLGDDAVLLRPSFHARAGEAREI